MASLRVNELLARALLILVYTSHSRGQAGDRQLALKQGAEARMAKGDVAPIKGNDPGDPIMQCLGVESVPFRVSGEVLRVIGAELSSMFPRLVGSQSVICANSEEGARVLAYREWYCNSKDAACTVSAWSNGEPTFSKPPERDINFNLSSSAQGAQTPGVRVRFTLARVYK